MDTGNVGYQVETDDIAIGTSGRPTAIYSVYIDSGAGGGGIVVLHNGTAATDATVFSIQGSAANARECISLAGGHGVVFPAGCFLEADANVDSVTVAYRKVQA